MKRSLRSTVTPNHIVEALLELTEGLPELKQELIAKYGDEIAGKLIASVPEKNGYAYLEWLASQYKKGLYNPDDSERMLKAINDFVRLERDDSKRDIMVSFGLYTVLDSGGTKRSPLKSAQEFMQTVENVVKEATTDWREWVAKDEAKIKSGTKFIRRIGDLELVKLENYEATRFFAVWPGNPKTSRTSQDDIVKHAGKPDENLMLPIAPWCIQNTENYAGYSACLYGVRKKNTHPKYNGYYGYVALSFSPGKREIQNQFNQPIKANEIAEILPLFDEETFGQFTSQTAPAANDDSIVNRLSNTVEHFLSIAMLGKYVDGRAYLDPKTGLPTPKYSFEDASDVYIKFRAPNIRKRLLSILKTDSGAVASLDQKSLDTYADITLGYGASTGYDGFVKALGAKFYGGYRSNVLEDDKVFEATINDLLKRNKAYLKV